MKSTEVCIVCGAKTASASMEITGHGWRCSPCSMQAEIRALENGRADVADHLTPNELEESAKDGRDEAVIGALMAVAGLAWMVVAIVLALRVRFVLVGAGFFGLGLVGMLKGILDKRQAEAGRREFADARVHSVGKR